jgi:hypothetical protein
MLPDKPVPLADDTVGCATERDPRCVQNGTQVYSVSMNREWLSQLGLDEQGAPTLHALTTRPVVVEHPAIIVQPAEVIER